jgi:uncharacterized membrane protein YczE
MVTGKTFKRCLRKSRLQKLVVSFKKQYQNQDQTIHQLLNIFLNFIFQDMHTEILSEQQQVLLPLLTEFSSSFILVGGTAIALQLGHRKSIDFESFH